MINKFSPELFTQRSGRSDYQRGRRSSLRYKRLMILGGFLLAVIGIGYGVFVYLEDDAAISGDLIPHIEASLPIKERPEEPGGIDIPHQDVEVFSQLDNAKPAEAKSAVEHLLPVTVSSKRRKTAKIGEIILVSDKKEAELKSKAPQRPKAVLDEDADGLPPAITEAVIEEEKAPALKALPEVIGEKATPKSAKLKKAKTPKVETLVKVKAKKKSKPVVKMAKKVAAKPADTQAEKAEIAMARLPEELFTGKKIPDNSLATAKATVKKPALKKAVKKVVQKKGLQARVQIASFPEEAVARREVTRYTKRFSSILKSVKLEVIRVEIPKKGTYYRIITQKLNKREAMRICADMKRKKGSCLVRR